MRNNSIRGLFLFLVMVFVTATSHAYTLAEYIQKNCKKHCVNADVLQDVVQRASASFRVDPRILLAIIEVESTFSTKARNGGSLGITQVFIKYHRDKFLGKNYFDVEDNVFVGAQILGDCMERHNQHRQKALSCYNGLPPNNPKYAIKVFRMMKKQSVIRLPGAKDHLQAFLVQKRIIDQH